MRAFNGRIVSAVVGFSLMLATVIEAYFQSIGFYRDHYVIPKEKYGVLTPLRWHDMAFLAVFWPVAIALFYASYRLIRYALRNEHSAPA